MTDPASAAPSGATAAGVRPRRRWPRLLLLRPTSIRALLVQLVVAALLPAALMMAAFIYREYHDDSVRTSEQTVAHARMLTRALDARLRTLEAQLTGFAMLVPREPGRWPAFHQEAQRLRALAGVEAIVLLDPHGRHVLDTRVPWGEPLPQQAPPEMTQAARLGRAAIHDLFQLPLSGQAAVGVGVPVVDDGVIRYVLTASIEAGKLGELLADQPLPEHWLVTVTDGSSRIIFQSEDQGRYAGALLPQQLRDRLHGLPAGMLSGTTLDGERAVVGFSESAASGWKVLVTAPRSELQRAVLRSVGWLVLAVTALLAISLLLARRFGERIVAAMDHLTDNAEALGRGQPVQYKPLVVAEARRLARAFQQASERVQTSARALQAGEQRLRGILDSAMDAIITIDAQHKVVLFNAAAERMFGVPAAQVLQQDLSLLMPERFRAGHAARVAKFDPIAETTRPMGSGRVVYGRRFDGEEFPIEATISSSVTADGQQLYTVIVRDITLRVRAHEALVRSNLELQRFAFVASHDLRAPLRTLAGYLELLRARVAADDERTQDLVRRMLRATTQMDSLTADLLAYARLQDSGRPFAPVAMEQVVRDTLDLLDAEIAATGAQVSVGALPTVTGDRTQLVQLLQNLLANALKYRAPGRAPVIAVDCERSETGWIFCVRDNGIGIAPEYHARVFEIFERLHTQREYPGNGIGLAVCSRVVQLHGGRIWVESEPGEGSTFRFSLPER